MKNHARSTHSTDGRSLYSTKLIVSNEWKAMKITQILLLALSFGFLGTRPICISR